MALGLLYCLCRLWLLYTTIHLCPLLLVVLLLLPGNRILLLLWALQVRLLHLLLSVLLVLHRYPLFGLHNRFVYLLFLLVALVTVPVIRRLPLHIAPQFQ